MKESGADSGTFRFPVSFSLLSSSKATSNGSFVRYRRRLDG